MSNDAEYKQAENKLLLLYLIDKMDLPLSRSQITDYVREAEFMDFFTLQQTLADMVDGGFLENAMEDNTTRYSITGDGQIMLEYFEKHIPISIRNMINNYVHNNRRNIKKEYEITATYFPNAENDEFVVKCGVYEDERTLLELAIAVDTRDQAKLIQTNWKSNAKSLYGRIIESLTVISPLGVTHDQI